MFFSPWISQPGETLIPALVKLSSWFKELSEQDRQNLEATIQLGTGHAAYSFLAILDGLVAIEPSGQKGKLELFYEKAETRMLLNDPGSDQLTFLFKE